ncbi:MAG: bile acid:sodium symporter family protein [Myxococcales bacterium]|nr:bile acid:sodium symporter family protein [Myxococcales bacterium]
MNFSPSSLVALNVVLGFVMFGVALDIRGEDFRRVLRSPKGPLIGLTAQFLLLPAFTFLLTRVISPRPSVALGMILVAACPGGNMSNFFTHHAKGNAALSVSMTAVSTVLAIVMTPLNLSFWGALHPSTRAVLEEVHLDPISLLLTVFMILGIPLLLGMAVASRRPRWAERLRRPMKIFSLVAFSLFIVGALAANWTYFLHYVGYVALAVAAHNALGLSLGYGSARLLRASRYDARAISIEVGIQNSALGLVLIFSYFHGLGGMAIVAAWWGVWHLVSGLTLSSYWSRRPV